MDRILLKFATDKNSPKRFVGINFQSKTVVQV